MQSLAWTVLLITTCARAGIAYVSQEASIDATCDDDHGLQLLQKTANSRKGEEAISSDPSGPGMQLLQKKAHCREMHWRLKEVPHAEPKRGYSLLSMLPTVETNALRITYNWLWPMLYLIMIIISVMAAGRIGLVGSAEWKDPLEVEWSSTVRQKMMPSPRFDSPMKSVPKMMKSVPLPPPPPPAAIAALPRVDPRLLKPQPFGLVAPTPSDLAPVQGQTVTAQGSAVTTQVKAVMPQGKTRSVSLNAMEVSAPPAFVETLPMQAPVMESPQNVGVNVVLPQGQPQPEQPVAVPVMLAVNPGAPLPPTAAPAVPKEGGRFQVLQDSIALEDGVELIEPEEVYDYVSGGNEFVVLVDVRDSDRKVGHIQGTIHVPCNNVTANFESKIEELLERFEDKYLVAFHCQFSCHRGPYCANLYRANAPESQRVAVMNGGFKGWVELGLPIVPGEGELADEVKATSEAIQQGKLAAARNAQRKLA